MTSKPFFLFLSSSWKMAMMTNDITTIMILLRGGCGIDGKKIGWCWFIFFSPRARERESFKFSASHKRARICPEKETHYSHVLCHVSHTLASRGRGELFAGASLKWKRLVLVSLSSFSWNETRI